MKNIGYVTALSWTAMDRFDEMKDKFHMGKDIEETKKHYLLRSLNNKYMCHCQKEGNEHWKITV